MRRIGIDVGGTNTDAVLLDGSTVVASVKVPTTAPDVGDGVANAIAALGEVGAVDAVMIGTTQFTNAVVERRRLDRVGVLRIGLPASASLPPLCDWPRDLAAAVDPLSFMVRGGHEFDGRPLVPLDVAGVRAAAASFGEAGVTAVAITAVFSPLTSSAEEEAAALVRDVLPGARITCSSTLGRIGLLERENVAVLNASLGALGALVVAGFEAAVAGLDAPVYLTQNDGTVVPADVAATNPVFCFASGPTNSMRGAALLSGLDDALVIDVGGTTSDVGALVGGFPREANGVVEVGGVRTLFRMPDLRSIALGGGTVVRGDVVGPDSVGHRIGTEALVFGGSTVTATDVAVAAGRVSLGSGGGFDAPDVLATIDATIADAVDRMKPSAAPVDLVAVGGGAFLVPDAIDGVGRVVRVPHAGVANAIGAAMAQVSGEVDQVFSGMGRAAALESAGALAVERAVAAGAAPSTISTLEVDDLPLAYLPGDARRVRVKVVGDLLRPLRP